MTKAFQSEDVKCLCSSEAANGAGAALGQNAEQSEDSSGAARDLCLCPE